MFKKILLSALCGLLFIPFTAIQAAGELNGKIVKTENSRTLYYITTNGDRLVFPNAKTFHSWFGDFSDVQTVTPEELAAYPLAGNVRYRPGVVLIKITESPRVYVVTRQGVLRWIDSEDLAKKLYGNDWAELIDDVPVAIFNDYTIGEKLGDDDDFDVDNEVEKTKTIDNDRGLALGLAKNGKAAETVRCRVLLADKTERPKGQERAQKIRECLHEIRGEDDDRIDTTAPILSDIMATSTATSTTVIRWKSNEPATGSVAYNSILPLTATSTLKVTNNATSTTHLFTLNNLTPSTTYYFIVYSADKAGNTGTSTQRTFTTLQVE